MPMTPEAAKKYKPRRPGTTLEDVVTPQERARRAEAIQAAKDEAELPKIQEAYDKSRTSMKKGGYVKAADGIAKRGKTRGVMVACGGGYMKKGK